MYGGIATRTTAGLTWLAGNHHGTAQIAIDATTLAVTTRRFTPFGDTRGTPPGPGPTNTASSAAPPTPPD